MSLPERYRDVELVARGGMGEVYRAEDSVLGRVVAVKVLSGPYADDAAVRGRFTREALAAARLSNAPSTITIFDVGEHEGRPHIVMEYLRGGSLADRLAAEGAQEPGRALQWLREAAAALDAAHAQGVVHRDVKPANLLLDDSDCIKVADFGVASAAGLDSFTAAGTVLGTAGYLSPEQARGERAGPPSDQYALAVVAFELLTGVRPYERDSAAAEAAAHVNAPVPSASAFAGQLPPELDAVFERGLAKDPHDRYASCLDFVGALREALDAAAGHTVVREATHARAPAPMPVALPSRRTRGPLALAALVGLALVGAALAFALTRNGADETQEPAPPGPTTVEQTVTLPGTTVVETVTTAPEEEPAPPPTEEEEPPPEEEEPPPDDEEPPPSGDPAALNDEGFRLMRAGDYNGALPLLEQAVAGLSGQGSLTEAYASYNLANTRFQLGRCDGVLELLDRSESIQGERSEITRLRGQAQDRCG